MNKQRRLSFHLEHAFSALLHPTNTCVFSRNTKTLLPVSNSPTSSLLEPRLDLLRALPPLAAGVPHSPAGPDSAHLSRLLQVQSRQPVFWVLKRALTRWFWRLFYIRYSSNINPKKKKNLLYVGHMVKSGFLVSILFQLRQIKSWPSEHQLFPKRKKNRLQLRKLAMTTWIFQRPGLNEDQTYWKPTFPFPSNAGGVIGHLQLSSEPSHIPSLWTSCQIHDRRSIIFGGTLRLWGSPRPTDPVPVSRCRLSPSSCVQVIASSFTAEYVDSEGLRALFTAQLKQKQQDVIEERI